MGYYAKGEGSAILKDGVDTSVVESVLKNLSNDDIEFDFDGKVIDFWENNSHWDETETHQFLNSLAPFITDGYAKYEGDEDCHWKYNFNEEKGSWDEQYGRIVFDLSDFTDDELVEELTRRGYDIDKNDLEEDTLSL